MERILIGGPSASGDATTTLTRVIIPIELPLGNTQASGFIVLWTPESIEAEELEFLSSPCRRTIVVEVPPMMVKMPKFSDDEGEWEKYWKKVAPD